MPQPIAYNSSGDPGNDIYDTPQELANLQMPTTFYTHLIQHIYIRTPNLGDQHEMRNDAHVGFGQLNLVAGQMLPPANQLTLPNQGVRMSQVLRRFEEQLTQVQDFLLGAP